MKIITVVSGKGGVGKSSITASLATVFSEKMDIVAADCDVDASNLGLILGVEDLEDSEEISTSSKVFFDEEKCTSCGRCKDICAFSAIDWNEDKQIPEINRYLCEGCGACSLVCPEGAFQVKDVKNAEVGRAVTEYDFPLVSGQLKMGESGSGEVVTEIKKRAKEEEDDLLLVDSAAGIGCPVIASVRGSEYVVAVVEPSPASLSDLKRVLQTVNHFGIDYGILINKYDLNEGVTEEIEDFVEKSDGKLLGKIPYDKAFVESLVEMKPVTKRGEKYREMFSGIAEKILDNVEN